MRVPLFYWMSEARQNPLVPKELRHSGILSLEFLRNQNTRAWLYLSNAPTGTALIEDIADRIHRQKPVKESTYRETQIRIAHYVYSNAPLTNYINRMGRFRCGAEICGGVRASGKWTNWTGKHSYSANQIEIKPVPMKPCKWCGKRVEFKPKWVDWHGQIRCNAPDCRRMSYLAEKPQSRGGIELTPAQRKVLDREAWDTQRAINYLNLRAKEIRNGRRTNHDVR